MTLNQSSRASAPLQAFIEKFEKGRLQPLRPALAASGELFDAHLQAQFATHLSFQDRAQLRFAAAARARALRLARAGRSSSASRAITEAQHHASLASTEVARSLAESFTEAVSAYVDYRAGDLTLAKTRVLNALRIDGELVRRHNYVILELHRVQLVHNLVRIAVRDGSVTEALVLALQILDFLEGDLSRWPISDDTTCIDPSCLPRPLTTAMFNQVLGEVALALSALDESASRRWNKFLEVHGAFSCRGVHEFEAAHAWLAVQHAKLAASSDDFLSSASAFIGRGRNEIALLWYTTAIDVATWCNHNGLLEEATALTRAIITDVDKVPSLAAAMSQSTISRLVHPVEGTQFDERAGVRI